MSDHFCKRNAAPITRNEYCILVNVHRHLSDSGPLHSTLQNATPLKRLAKATGVETSVAREAIRLSKAKENPPDRHQRDIQTIHEIVRAIRKVFLERQNDTAIRLVNLNLLTKRLASQHNIVLDERTLLRYLRKLKYHMGQDILKTSIFESQTAIDYRNLYVERRMSNASCYGLPIKPEVFVDESFWTLDQNLRPIRVSHGAGLKKRGQEPMLVVFGAMVVFSFQSDVFSEWVPKSVLIWPTGGLGRDLPGSIRTDEELWRSVPSTVKKAGIATDLHDGHFYYSALEDTIWENMFESLCQTLYRDYGSCQIHMDEADPHMRRENMLPYAPKKLEDVHEWFIKNELPIPTGHKGERLSKAELLVRAREAKVPPRFASDTIASKHSHTVLRIARHYYEFQPLERVWNVGNMSTTAIPRTTEPELNLRNRLLEVFAGLKEAQLLNCWQETYMSAFEYHSVYRSQKEIGQVSQGETDSEWSDEGT